MALNTLKCNHLTSQRFKGLTQQNAAHWDEETECQSSGFITLTLPAEMSSLLIWYDCSI